LTLILRPEWGPACGVEGLQLSTGVAGGQVHPALCAGEAYGLLCFAFFACERQGEDMSEPSQVIGRAVSRLLAEFERDPQAVLVALLTLLYGQPLEVTRLARWVDFDLRERVWRVGADRLPLTAQALDLLARYWSVAEGHGEYLFTGADGQPLRKSRVVCRVLKLSGGVLPLKTLQAWALKGCPELDSANVRSEILQEFAVRGASVVQVAGLARELEARLRASVAGWHDVLLVRRALDEFAE